MEETDNLPESAKYIGYECIICKKKIDKDEREKIILLGCFQTWCVSCIDKNEKR